MGGLDKVINVAAGLVFREGKLLITQRRPEDHLGGLWEFPGGKVEHAETFEACLHRELKEELGISVRNLVFFETVTHEYPEKKVQLRFFRADWQEGKPQPLACAAIAWIERHELSAYRFPEADTMLLAHLQSMPELWA